MRRASLRLGSLATHLQQPAAAAMSRRGTARTMARAAGEPVPVAAAPAPPLGPAAFSLVGRRAIVTGATKGIGAATAVALARAGADVAVLGRDVAGLAATAAAVRAEGRDAWPIKADFATTDGTAAAAAAVLAVSVDWDVIVNNHGMNTNTPLLPPDPANPAGFTFDTQTFDEVLAVNLRAVAQFTSAVAVPLVAAGRPAAVVNVSSMQAFFGLENQAAYGASKAALNQLTRLMAVELGRHDIRANAVCPGVTLTAMGKDLWDSDAMAERKEARLKSIPLRRFAEPEDIANAVLFLAADASRYLNGHVIVADGGWNIAP